MLDTQLSRTTKLLMVKDINLPEIFAVFKSSIVISRNVRLPLRNQKISRGKIQKG